MHKTQIHSEIVCLSLSLSPVFPILLCEQRYYRENRTAWLPDDLASWFLLCVRHDYAV